MSTFCVLLFEETKVQCFVNIFCVLFKEKKVKYVVNILCIV